MKFNHQATRIELLRWNSPPMRAFHLTWFSFFLCFFAWFGIAPLMKVVRDELHLTPSQMGWCLIASVAGTIVARIAIGWVCDRYGPRLAYTWLLILGSLPVMGIGLARDFETFLMFRLLIGMIGASFVITQYHTSVMFAPNCVGTANAVSAGWGNLGGGVTQLAMPAVFALLVGVLGLTEQASWRVAMLVVGAVCGLTGIAYYFLTQDAPEGSFSQLRSAGKLPSARQSWRDFLVACRDARVWALFIVYGACFGVELTVDNIAALYFSDYFGLGLMHSGFLAFLFGVLNVFGRALGGIFGDRFAGRWGLRGRVVWLFLVLFGEGLTLMLFSQMRVLAFAIPALLVFSLFMQMATGATYSVVPFINRKALGAVSGIVGAGGNAGAVAAALLFQGSMPWPTALLVLGFLVTVASTTSFAVRFTPETETEAHAQYWAAVQRRHGASPVPEPVGA